MRGIVAAWLLLTTLGGVGCGLPGGTGPDGGPPIDGAISARCPVPVGAQLSVHAAIGNDQSGLGTPERPVRSITRGLALAASCPQVLTLRIAGGDPAAPLT